MPDAATWAKLTSAKAAPHPDRLAIMQRRAARLAEEEAHLPGAPPCMPEPAPPPASPPAAAPTTPPPPSCTPHCCAHHCCAHHCTKRGLHPPLRDAAWTADTTAPAEPDAAEEEEEADGPAKGIERAGDKARAPRDQGERGGKAAAASGTASWTAKVSASTNSLSAKKNLVRRRLPRRRLACLLPLPNPPTMAPTNYYGVRSHPRCSLRLRAPLGRSKCASRAVYCAAAGRAVAACSVAARTVTPSRAVRSMRVLRCNGCNGCNVVMERSMRVLRWVVVRGVAWKDTCPCGRFVAWCLAAHRVCARLVGGPCGWCLFGDGTPCENSTSTPQRPRHPTTTPRLLLRTLPTSHRC